MYNNSNINSINERTLFHKEVKNSRIPHHQVDQSWSKKLADQANPIFKKKKDLKASDYINIHQRTMMTITHNQKYSNNNEQLLL